MTVREISKITGVSLATICKAFKDPNSVKSKTWKKIEPFYKNSFRKESSQIKIVHIVIPNISNSFFADILTSIVDSLYKVHIAPIIHFSDDEQEKESAIIKSIPNDDKIGLLWLPSSHSKISELPQLLARKTVLIDRDIECNSIKMKVLVDNYQIAKEATEIIIKGNALSPAFIDGSIDTYTARERARGVQEIFAHYEFLGERIFYGEFSNEQLDFSLCKELLSSNKYDSFILGNQTISYSFLRAVKYLDLKIPEDIRCIAFDYLPQRDLLLYPLSVVSLPAQKIGLKATELLLNYDCLRQIESTIFIESTIYLYGSEYSPFFGL